MRKILQTLYFLFPTIILTYEFNKFLPYIVNLLHGKEGESLFHFDVFIVVTAFFGIFIFSMLFILEKNLFPKWWNDDVDNVKSQGRNLVALRKAFVYLAVISFAISVVGLFSVNNYIRTSDQTISASNFSPFNNENNYTYNQVKVYATKDSNDETRTRFIFSDGKDIGSIEGESTLASIILDKQSKMGISSENLPNPNNAYKFPVVIRILVLIFGVAVIWLTFKFINKVF